MTGHDISLLVYTLLAIIFLIFMIAKVKWHPFVVLLLTSVILGMLAGMKLPDVADAIQNGVGNTLGSIAVIIGLGTILGKMLAESCGADQIANTLLNKFGEKKVHWAMMIVAFIVGIPVFFEVGLVLLIPLVYTVARRSGMSILKIGIPMVAGLSTVHGLLPPHPAPMIAVEGLDANVARTILYALIVGIPSVIIAGPIFGSFIAKRLGHIEMSKELSEQFSKKETNKLPSFGVTIFTVLLPVILMLVGSISGILHENKALAEWSTFLGKPIVALLISVIVSFFTLGYARGFNKKQLSSFMGECLAPTATIILVIGGGGAFKNVLITSGVGDAIANLATNTHISPILFAWLVAALIRVATGSASVAMTTAVGIVAPVIASTHGVNTELIVLAIGSGSLILSHVNDAGFWMVKEFFNMSVSQTLKSWTVMETLLSIVSLIIVLLLSIFV
ncbi:GntP family permease [Bacillus sporothermodurans]|uniref:GntP family permease n=1 Tax=Heyndrickxia sporothermodurans TaxID=46224 RepID=UPI00192C7BB7|nr:GntP family permease [Heyndrickxia sporothermodurans]MBL5799274.1 GntP family permease [Heyndrickxia sporothermodurans]MBL5810155.1 GntP family permease [Heyndrickxia sporothermodurans]MBL5813743.1 GntP family permease [Heyndrickxia sporothermodurans]MBL5817142.1 GntP family permease [Heyndrickxia sporothermodurans]MBL5842456.1 GntP family permease [Heyndrickxia sporothermodurans]